MTANKTLHDFTLQDIAGKPLPLAQFKGKVVLLVNTASECSYTVQYEALEELWLANRDKGLVVVGVPANDFGAQEPGSAGEIASFCKINYGVTFPLTEKLVVKGEEAHPLYKWAIEKAGRRAGRNGISINICLTGMAIILTGLRHRPNPWVRQLLLR